MPRTRKSNDSGRITLMTVASTAVTILAVVYLSRGPAMYLAAFVNRTCAGDFAMCVKAENRTEDCKVCSNGGGGERIADSCRECTAGKERCENALKACNGEE